MSHLMRTTAILTVLLLPLPGLYPQELAAWIPSTDRTSNPVIGEILVSSCFEDRLQAAEGLGLREDPYVADLIGLLLGRLHGPGRHAEELVLTVLLASVFPRSLAPEEVRRRIEVNLPVLQLLPALLPEIGAPLARETYRLLSHAQDGSLRAALAAEGRRLGEALKSRDGCSNVEQADRLMAYLGAVERVGDPDLAGGVVAVLETTRTREVGQKARRVLETLLSAAAAGPRVDAQDPGVKTDAGNPGGWSPARR